MGYMNNLNSMYRDPTEVPSYGLWSSLANLGSKAVSGVGNVLSNAATNVGNAFTSAGAGNFGNAVGSLYSGVDNLVGGILPGGQAFGQGYLGQLYTGADKMLGGYLPNVGGGAAAGGAGYTPQYMSAQRAFDALPGPAHLNPNMVGTSFNGGPVTYSPISGAAAGGGGVKGMLGRGLDNIGKVSNIANPILDIYEATQMTPTQNSVQEMQILNPGGGGGGVQMIPTSDPAAAGAPGFTGSNATGGASVPTTMSATGGKQLTDIKDMMADTNRLNKELQEKIDNLNEDTDKDTGRPTAPNSDRLTTKQKEAEALRYGGM